MIHAQTVIAILFIALTTYLTRVLGYMLLKHKTLSSKHRQILEATPGCVLISIIAPYFVQDHPASIIAMIITVIAAAHFSLLPTVAISMLSAALLRYAFI